MNTDIAFNYEHLTTSYAPQIDNEFKFNQISSDNINS